MNKETVWQQTYLKREVAGVSITTAVLLTGTPNVVSDIGINVSNKHGAHGSVEINLTEAELRTLAEHLLDAADRMPGLEAIRAKLAGEAMAEMAP